MAIPGFVEGARPDPQAALLPDDGFDARLDATRALLARIARDYQPAVFACSFSVEDCVLLDLLAAHAPAVETVTLDTGRLPQETYDLIAAYAARSGIRIRVMIPQADDVETWVAQYGINGFRDSLQARQSCCHVRKVAPLARVLAGKCAWVTGLRRAQSADRQSVMAEVFDAERGLRKFNPLHDWSDDEIWHYARGQGLPVHALYTRGYRSIGCAPCTRAVTVGEDPRAGRWWWEEKTIKECGLHATPRQRKLENVPENVI